jgi:hypothetical protein
MSPRNFFDIDISPDYDDDREDSFNEDTNNEILNCERRRGVIRHRRWCGQKIEVLNGVKTNYGEGSIHICGGIRNW